GFQLAKRGVEISAFDKPVDTRKRFQHLRILQRIAQLPHYRTVMQLVPVDIFRIDQHELNNEVDMLRRRLHIIRIENVRTANDMSVVFNADGRALRLAGDHGTIDDAFVTMKKADVQSHKVQSLSAVRTARPGPQSAPD